MANKINFNNFNEQLYKRDKEKTITVRPLARVNDDQQCKVRFIHEFICSVEELNKNIIYIETEMNKEDGK